MAREKRFAILILFFYMVLLALSGVALWSGKSFSSLLLAARAVQYIFSIAYFLKTISKEQKLHGNKDTAWNVYASLDTWPVGALLYEGAAVMQKKPWSPSMLLYLLLPFSFYLVIFLIVSALKTKVMIDKRSIGSRVFISFSVATIFLALISVQFAASGMGL